LRSAVTVFRALQAEQSISKVDLPASAAGLAGWAGGGAATWTCADDANAAAQTAASTAAARGAVIDRAMFALQLTNGYV
jgi:hypothetical protein